MSQILSPLRCLTVLILVLPALTALVAPARPAPANEALEQAMGQMNSSLKALGKGISAETRSSALEELGKFEQAVIAAKSAVPDSAAKVDEKKRDAFVAEFRAN